MSMMLALVSLGLSTLGSASDGSGLTAPAADTAPDAWLADARLAEESIAERAKLRPFTLQSQEMSAGQSSPNLDEGAVTKQARQDPFGYYFRIGGLAVEPQSDAQLVMGGAEVDTNTGYGISVAAGFRFDHVPISVELEYAYRQFETESYVDPGSGMLGENRFSLHTITANVMLDTPNLIGPIGAYAGAGLGIRLTEFRFSNSGGGSQVGISGEGFFWQAMAGVTLSLGQQTQLYGGVRWVDGGQHENSVIRLDTQAVNVELGLRIFF